MSQVEYWLAAAVLRLVGWLANRLPVRERVVLASPRTGRLDGNLLYLEREIRARRPDLPIVRLLEPYSYRFLGKLAYAARLIRGMVLLRTSRTFIVDNAYLPVHVAPHPPRTTVIQVWHAAGALKRFGFDANPPPNEPERTFLHRHYDWVVSSAEASRGPWSGALRTPPARVVPLGTPRVDFFHDAVAVAAARAAIERGYPALAGRRVITYAPTFRGRGRGKRPGMSLDTAAVRSALAPGDVLAFKGHPNLDPGLVDTAGYDAVIDPRAEMNDVLAATDILITDYSSSIFEFALLRRPLILLIGDLADYEREPGLYLDLRTEMIGRQATDTAGVADAIRDGRFDLGTYDAFIARHLGASDGGASARFVERFLPA